MRNPFRRAHKSSTNFSLNVPPEITGFHVRDSIAPRISRSEALQVPAVLRARNLIAGTLSTLPIKAHGPDRKVVPWALFEQLDRDMPNSVVLSQTYEDLLFEGIAWWRVTELGWHGYPTKIRRVPVESVHVFSTGTLSAQDLVSPDHMIPEDGMVFIDGIHVPDNEIIRFDSPNPPLLVHGARAIRTCLKLDKAAGLYADDPLPLGFFTPKEGVDPGEETDIQLLLDKWEEARSKKAFGYVGAALEAHFPQWNPEELQLSEARQHAVLEIARTAGVDPEDLGVSTTSRTYQNAEHRRLDLLDFTLGAYVSAVQDRLSMNDVQPRGYVARIKFDTFLRSDTSARAQTYAVGLTTGMYTREEIRELEDKPSLTADELAALGPEPQTQEVEAPMEATKKELHKFSTANDNSICFDLPIVHESFKVDEEKRTITGLAVPWNEVATSDFAKWKFAPNSLSWTDESRVKLNLNHKHEQSIGKAVRLQNTSQGLSVSFKIARGDEGDKALALAADGVYDGLSIEPEFTDTSWAPDPKDKSVRLVTNGILRAVGLTAMPAFDSARVERVAASKDGLNMSDTTVKEPEAPDFAQFTAGLSESITKAVEAAFTKSLENISLPVEQRESVSAGRPTVQVIREAPVYTLDGNGPSFVKDAWDAMHNRNDDALDRVRKYQKQSEDMVRAATKTKFATGTTTSLPEIIPPGYRPELYVGQLPQGRPLVESVSRGALTDATPFTIPRFVSATGAAADHVQGTNPTDGTLDLESVTVTPGGVSGLLRLTREIVDSSNPAIDQIALDAMREAYSQNTEAKVYAELNGTNGAGGVITAGFVPSGAQAATSTGGSAAAGTFGGKELLAKLRNQLALYPFRRFASPNRLHLSQEGTSAFADAVDSQGRPLLPSVNAQNAVGLGNALTQGWFVDGLAAVPTWSMTGNAAGDSDVLMWNAADVWAWESALLNFRFEERQGPANIDLALFGYFAVRIIRPRGVSGIRHTVGA